MPDSDLEFQAINQALKANWPKAIELNLKFLASSPNNVDCLNRLAKAYLEDNKISKCIETLKKVLKIDKYNPIAKKNLQRLSLNRLKYKRGESFHQRSGSTFCLFIEEPGKTKILRLLNLAPKSTLVNVGPLDEVSLIPKRHTIQVTTLSGKYIGALPDDIAKRLTTLIKGGNKYDAFVKSVEKKEIDVFIREIERSNKFKNQPSFLSKIKEVRDRQEVQESEEAETEEKNEENEESNY